MNRSRSRLFVLVLSTLALLGVVTPASAAADPSCGLTWGSLPKTLDPFAPGDGVVDDVRAGRHACFDRVVLDVAEGSGAPSYAVRYVSQVTSPATGDTVPVRGGARLQVTVGAVVTPGTAPDDSREVVDVAGFDTLRQVVLVASYEGLTDYGIGTRARLPFRVFLLDGGSGTGHDVRMVIDVAHRW